MSQLLHFYWEGKERSVSVSNTQEGLALNFVDPEIYETLGGKVLMLQNKGDWDYFTTITRNQLSMLSSILKALETSIGKNLQTLTE